MIKALFFDLDGTLLNDEKEISLQTQKALATCVEKGIRLFAATARPPLLQRMTAWSRQIQQLFEGGVYQNGGCLVHGLHKEYVAVADDVVRDVTCAVQQQADLNMALQLEDEVHAFRFPLGQKWYKCWGIEEKDALQLAEAKGRSTVKMLLFYKSMVDANQAMNVTLVGNIRELCQNKAQFYLMDNGQCIQITGQAANKHNGVEKLRQRLGLAKEEIAVFGDDSNDVEMLRACPNSVAMGNAADEVKAAARYVTVDNNRDGVLYALRDMLQLVD